MKKIIIFFCLFINSNNYASSVLFQAFNKVGFTGDQAAINASYYFHAITDNQKKIIVVGTTADSKGLIVRLCSDGSLDTTFNQVGYINTNDDTGATAYRAVILDSQQKIIVVGDTADNVVIARYNSDGSLDTTFNTPNGYAIGTVGMNATSLFSVKIDSQKRIIATGTINGNDGIVVRYNSNGLLDTSFNSPNGYINTENGTDSYSFTDCAIDSQDRIVVVGFTDTFKSVIVRYDSNGSLDNSFNPNDGYIISSGGEFGNGVIIDRNNKIIVASSTADSDGVVTRYNSDGSLDTSFNSPHGYINIDNGIRSASYYKLAIDSNNNIIAVGYTDNPDNNGLIIRVTSDGIFDTQFNKIGFVNTENGTNSKEYYALTIDNEDRIIAVGYNDASKGLIARYLANGVLDTVSNWTLSNFRAHYNYNNNTIGLLT